MLNSSLNGYTLKKIIGSGGMADVYYAENKLGLPAAIKVLKKKFCDEKSVHDRFIQEAQIMVGLDHPNIRKVFDIGELHDQPAIIMEYLDGHSLSELLHAQKKFDSEELKAYFTQCCDALRYTHSRNIIHRDIKPSNIFLTKDGQIKIVDFGIAKVKEGKGHTNTGQTLGTVVYMSPEQVKDPKRLNYKTDNYSLAVTFFHLLTGKAPYDLSTHSDWAVQTKIVHEELNLGKVPTDWQKVLKPLLLKDAQKRSELSLLSFDTPISPEITIVKSPPKPTPEPAPKRPWFIILIIIIICQLLFYCFIDKNNNKYINVILLLLYFISYGILGVLGGWLGEKFIKGRSLGLIGNIIFGILGGLGGLGGVFCLNLLNICSIKEPYTFIVMGISAAFIPFISVLIRKFIKQRFGKDKLTAAPPPTPKSPLPKTEKNEVKPPPKPKGWWLLVLGLFVVAGAYYFFSGNTNIIAQLEKNMVYVAGGSFTMGCTSEQGSDCYDNEKPAHPVSVKSFYIGKYEVTQAEWRAVMGSDPEELYFKGCDRCPVENVSWEDVQDFLKKLNAQTGKNYRLPSEAEWEYAARGGNKSKGYIYAGSNNISSVAWYEGNSKGKTHPVGNKQANELDLYDMSGNVYEWCGDWYKGYPGSNDISDFTDVTHVFRGGSWYYAATYCRSSHRFNGRKPGNRDGRLGFRLAL
ncbi:MAG: SUMF1/EgtB/PvdO family nonheme iron enzyme [Bacteroidetes bacterium]|nr:SUMF1/EgtB/PvdO family nonheme iron enzyme [Bacteroidota bacterium]MCB9044231.1 SUMF1/EgtB/PvdO family nonheme iron enzyme [Chitinophagales bacterium]